MTAVGSPAPDPAVAGFYLNGPNCHFGHYRLQRTDARIALVLTSFVASAACLEHTPARAMFVLPLAYRPPMTIVREVAVEPGPRFLVPEAACRIRLRVEPDGRVHYEPATPAFDLEALLTAHEATAGAPYYFHHHKRQVLEEGVMAYASTDGCGIPMGEFTLSTRWGATPAVNDQVVLAILDELWFGKPVLARIPVPTRETPAITGSGMCRPLALNPEGRVTELSLQEHLRSAPIPPELGQLTGLKCLHLPAPPSIATGAGIA